MYSRGLSWKKIATGQELQLQKGVRRRVLVADDDEAVLRVVTRALSNAGFEVVTAHDGLQAGDLLTRESFTAVLTDVAMPGMSGIEVLRAVRVRDLELPVILMTGAPSVESAAQAVRYGACEYITKPISLVKLVQSVRRAVDLYRLAQTKRAALEALGTGQPYAGDRAGLEVTLNRALESMWLAYQPIVALGPQSTIGYEALLRSNETALPDPGAILAAAERLGLLRDVGRRVRQIAPAPMSMLTTDPPLLLFINLHSSDLNDDELFSSTTALTSIATRVVFEITERASLDEVHDPRSRVAKLREMGFRVAIDDLGAGYAGLTSFAQLEPEFVKLDMSLIRGVHTSAVKQKLVRSMTSLCRDMGIAVVAEGIETVDERDAVVDLGCDLLQGYLFAKPGKPFPRVQW